MLLAVDERLTVIPLALARALVKADKEYDGTLWIKDGLRVKYLPQEPDLDPALTVMDNIRRGISEQV